MKGRKRDWMIEPAETFLITVLFTFGFILALPESTVNHSAYEIMVEHIFPEWLWGFVFMAVSFILLLSFIYHIKVLKIISLSLTTFLWSYVGTVYIIASILDGALYTGITYIVIAFLSVWLTYRVSETNN